MQFLLCYDHPATRIRLLPPGFRFACIGEDRLVTVSAEIADGRLIGAAHQAWSVPLEIRLFRATGRAGAGCRSGLGGGEEGRGITAFVNPALNFHAQRGVADVLV